MESLQEGEKSEKGARANVSIRMLQKIQEDINDKENDDLAMKCSWSNEDSLEVTKIAIEEILKSKTISHLPIEKIVALFGLVGVPVSHKVDKYADPMNILINGGLLEVAPGDKTHLNQKSLWSPSGRELNENFVQHTASNMTVTAVIPIRFLSRIQYQEVCIYFLALYNLSGPGTMKRFGRPTTRRLPTTPPTTRRPTWQGTC